MKNQRSQSFSLSLYFFRFLSLIKSIRIYMALYCKNDVAMVIYILETELWAFVEVFLKCIFKPATTFCQLLVVYLSPDGHVRAKWDHFHVELEWKEESFQHRSSHYCIAQSINSLMLYTHRPLCLNRACLRTRERLLLYIEPFFASQKLAQTLKSSASFKKVFSMKI